MRKESPMPSVFRLARNAPEVQDVVSPDAPPSAKSAHRRSEPRKTSQRGDGRFISRMVKTIEKLRRQIAHMDRQSVNVTEAAKSARDAATRSVVEQRESAQSRKLRQTAAIDRLDAERRAARAAVVDFAAGVVDANECIRRVNDAMNLSVPGIGAAEDDGTATKSSE